MRIRAVARAIRDALWRARHQPLGSARALAALPAPADFHLGCGNVRLPDRVNIDVRQTRAVDIVADLNAPRLPPARSVVSAAFFEHLYRLQRVPHLTAVREALVDEGWVLYAGLPDFREIARLYLEGAPGIAGDTFDLFNVYRYTHGDPEHVAPSGWVAQLHKSLFDREELEGLLRAAGFGSWVIGTYAWGEEPHRLNLVFYARADEGATAELATEAVRSFEAAGVRLDSLRWG